MRKVYSKEKQRATKRLYFDNPYQVEFRAKVLEKGIFEHKPSLILDQTCFYPESGGQPSDKGTINSVRVFNVLEEGEQIVHLLEEDIEAEEVRGKIDWETRFDYMQQHTGQHILSQSFYELFGAETLSFHLGEDLSTVEIDIRKVIEDDVGKVESRANEIVFQNREIKKYFISEERIGDVPLRKPPQKKGTIRVVEVADFDYSACGGTHCRRAGEVGIIKIIKWERIRNNIRFEFVCGKRALKDYTLKNRVLNKIATHLTVHEREVISSVENALSDIKSQKKKIKKMQERIALFEAREIIRKTKEKIIKDILRERTPEEVRFLALNIIKSGDFVVLFGAVREKRAHMVLACSESLNLDMRELVPLVSPLIEGRGGGSSSLVEIAGEKIENLKMALDKAYEFVRDKSTVNIKK